MKNGLPAFTIPLLIIAAFVAGYYCSDIIPKGEKPDPASGTNPPIVDSSTGNNQSNKGTDKPPVTPPEEKLPALVKCEPIQFTDDLSAEDLLLSLQNSIKFYEGDRSPDTVSYGEETVSREKIVDTLKSVVTELKKRGLSESFYTYINDNFQFYRTSAKSVLFTGYYLASLNGSRTQTPKYKYPLYKKPSDLVIVQLKKFSFFETLKTENPDLKGLPGILKGRLTNKTIVPYYTKMDIDYEGKLAGKGLELLWVDSPVDRFFLQVQGSGIVQFEDGSKQMVNYAESNGQTYRSIGKMLISKGILTEENVSMKAIRDYLAKNPEQVKPVLTHDPSYVFFRQVQDGPFGCFGVPVTTFRSIATDRKCYPAAGLAIIKTQKPVFDEKGEITKWVPFTRFVLNQDTGGAIKGTARVDLYCGYGAINEKTAGHMKQEGTIYFILKK